MLRSTALLSLLSYGLGSAACHVANAQITPDLPSLSLKSGEVIEVMDLWWSVNCKSLLKDVPVAEILEGPTEVTVSVKPAMVFARAQNCSEPITGGKLFLAAKDVADYSTSKLNIRITYDTKDGERIVSESYNITLLPKQE